MSSYGLPTGNPQAQHVPIATGTEGTGTTPPPPAGRAHPLDADLEPMPALRRRPLKRSERRDRMRDRRRNPEGG